MKKNKKEAKEKSTFMKMWENKQGRAIIKLFGYFLFIGVIIIFLKINYTEPSTTDNNEIKKEITYGEKQKELLNSNIKYIYTINIDSNKYVYEGNIKDKVNKGYKKTQDSLVEYCIDDTGEYLVKLDNKVITTELYEEINKELIDVNNIFNIIVNISPDISYEEDIITYKYNTIVNDINYEIKVISNTTSIESIEIISPNENYNLNFEIVE